MNLHQLSFRQFQQAIAAANRHFAMIRKKYPTLRAYLMLSLRGNQTKPENDLADSLSEFPSILLDNTAKSKALQIIKKLKPLVSTNPEQFRLKEELMLLSKSLEFDGGVQFEIRFHDLDYDLIQKLQFDQLVDNELTLQSKASIRIVLGTVSDFWKHSACATYLRNTKS